MIRIQRQTDIPATLQSAKINAAKMELQEKFSRGEEIQSSDFHSEYWRAQDVKDALFNSQRSKCCFCENIRSSRREFDAEHFRPKAGIDEDPGHPGYWWLGYEWSNLLYACKPCNQKYKRNQFPISGTRAYRPDGNLENEYPMLINPIEENPEDFIGFDWQQAYGKMVKAYGLDPRGSKTIEIVGLNRHELMEERASHLYGLQAAAKLIIGAQHVNNQDMVAKTVAKIQDMTSSKRRFSAFRRAFFRGQGLGDYIADD